MPLWGGSPSQCAAWRPPPVEGTAHTGVRRTARPCAKYYTTTRYDLSHSHAPLSPSAGTALAAVKLHVNRISRTAAMPPADPTVEHQHQQLLDGLIFSDNICRRGSLLTPQAAMAATQALVSRIVLAPPQRQLPINSLSQPAAGLVGDYHESTAQALSWEPRPPTPERLQRFTHPARRPPGEPVRHPGAARDTPHQGPFGKKSTASHESVADCLGGQSDTEFACWHQHARATDRCGDRRHNRTGPAN